MIGGAALVGAGVGAILSGPLLAMGLAGGAAACTLRKDQVWAIWRGSPCTAVVRSRRE